jgi:hypothetical protein
MADIPDIDLSKIGTVSFGDFEVSGARLGLGDGEVCKSV